MVIISTVLCSAPIFVSEKGFDFFGQLKSGLENDCSGGRPFDENKLDVNQAFVDVTLVSREKTNLTIRVGRQEVELG